MKKRWHIIKLRLRRLWWLIGLVTILSVSGAVLMHKFDLFGVEGQELGAYDGGLTFWTKKVEPSKDVVLLGVDEQTIQAIGKDPQLAFEYNKSWPYKRKIWSLVMQYLAQQGAKAVVMDVIMPQSGTDGIEFQNALKKVPIPVYIGFDFNKAQDTLPKVPSKTPVPVYAPQFTVPAQEGEFEETVEESAQTPEQQSLWKEAAAKNMVFPVSFERLSPPTRDLYPLPPMEEAWGYAKMGLVSSEADEDAKMRRVRFAYCDPAQNCYVSLATRVVADLLHADQVHVTPGQLRIGNRAWKINPDGSSWLNYGGDWKEHFQAFSLIAALLDARTVRDKTGGPLLLPNGSFKDKIVVIAGFAAATGDDKVATPFTGQGPGGIKHATEIENLLRTGFIVDAPYWVSVLVGILLAAFSILVTLVIDSALVELLWPIAVFFGFYLIPGFFLAKYHVHVLSIMPALAGSFASVLASVYKNFLADKEREELRELFSKYMEKDVVDLMVEQHQLPTLMGEEKEITVFFSGVPHFSKRVMNLPIAERMKLLNQYLSMVTSILVEEGACIDKYVGDQVRALFNTPIYRPDHALAACRAALRIQQACKELALSFQVQKWPVLSTYIGIHTDKMWVGNVGTEQLIDYTAIGEGMDFAAALQQDAAQKQIEVLVSSQTYGIIFPQMEVEEKGSLPAREGGPLVAIYRLLGEKSPESKPQA